MLWNGFFVGYSFGQFVQGNGNKYILKEIKACVRTQVAWMWCAHLFVVMVGYYSTHAFPNTSTVPPTPLTVNINFFFWVQDQITYVTIIVFF